LLLDLTQGILLSESAGASATGLFPPCTKLFLANSHQNSLSPKIKMAADLAASHLIDFIGFLAPQVGLEPTTPNSTHLRCQGKGAVLTAPFLYRSFIGDSTYSACSGGKSRFAKKCLGAPD
jgi:hypothetical protein